MLWRYINECVYMFIFRILSPYLWVILLYSSLESRLIPAVLEGQVRLFWNWLGQEFDSCHIAVKLEIESVFQAV